MTSVPLDSLVALHRMGFKLIPLAKDGQTPTINSTNEVYNNPDYWTPQKLENESYRFSNVGTTYGKTHLKDEQGKELYLCELDIDSNEVLTNLAIMRVKDKEYFFIDEICKITYVVRTRKKYGYRIYWLSHKQHTPIRTKDCKPGHEFEIKTDNTSGHGTLPPSRHRDDFSFHYQAIGQDKIAIQDKLYDGILKALADCLKPRKKYHPKPSKDTHRQEKSIILTDDDIQNICDLIRPHYKKGNRHNICYTLSGLLHKSAVHEDCATGLLHLLAKDDEEIGSRIANLNATYKKNRREVSGYNAFYTILQNVTGDDSIAKNILSSIDRVVNNKTSGNDKENGNSLLETLIRQFTFKTIRDTEEVYYYDEIRGVYKGLGETIIKEQLEILCPMIRTHEVNEIINKIKRRTYVNLSEFDKDLNICNLRNGLLNIMTGELVEHNPKYLSLVQLPINYDPKAKCPNILRFLGQVLQPKDVFTVLQLFGYCLYRTAKYEKAVMCCGKGDNGKGTLLKLFERFLGDQNVSHASIQELNNDRFAIADLHGKLAVCADLKAEKLTNTGTFKMLVSGDTIRAQKKHGQPFDFRNIAKLIFSANEIPESNDQTYAYFKRWIILLFNKIFQGEDKDTNLIEKLTTEEELSGLLNLAIIALKQLIKDNGFIHVDDVQSIQREYNQNATIIDEFLNNKCRIDPTDRDNYTICRDVYHSYVLHCKDSNKLPVSDNVFGGHLIAKGIKKERKMVNRTREHCYVGVYISQ